MIYHLSIHLCNTTTVVVDTLMGNCCLCGFYDGAEVYPFTPERF